jgi:hypothetical protein
MGVTNANGLPDEVLPDDLLPLTQAAKLLPGDRPGRGVHVSTLYRWVYSGRLRAWLRCGRVLVSRAEVLGLNRPVEAGRAAHLPAGRRARTSAEYDAWVDAVLARYGPRKKKPG